MIYAQPGQDFTAVLDAEGETGLVGTVTLQIENVDGTTHTAASTTSIVEIETGIYTGVRTAPDDQATYVVVWNNAGSRAAEELIVTSTLPSPGGLGTTGLTFLEMVNEVKARGFDEVGDERIKRWVNRAYARLCDRQVWPFLVTSTSGVTPLTISDLQMVYNVRNTSSGTTLSFKDIRAIHEDDPRGEDSGAAEFWYLAASNVLTVYPADGVSVAVDYVRSAVDLEDDGDYALVPPRYRMLLVDMAVCEAYKDSDNLEAWQILRGDVEEQLVEMENSLLVPNYDSAETIQAAGGSTDW